MRDLIINNAETLFLLVSLISVTAGYIGYRIINSRRVSAAQLEVRKMLATAEREADTIRRAAEVAAKGEALAAREAFEKQTAATRTELNDREKQLIAREAGAHEKTETLTRREEALQQSEQKAAARQAELDRLKHEAEALAQQLGQELQRISGLSVEQARQQLLQRVEHDVQSEAATMVRRITHEARDNAERDAKRILGIAMQRLAPDCVSDATTTTVPLPGEEMKGRIIGRDGRNIRAFEAATGVSVIIDETPQVVVLSGYEPVRREIARLAMGQLVADGRIHPGRIEEVVKKVEAEMEQTIRQNGEDACQRAGVPDIHPELVKLLGRLKYRHSYSQNVLDHSVEVAHLAGAMAGELKLDVQLAKRIGLLHDIGKAVSQEIEGAHALAGADVLRHHDEREEVITAVASHHGDAEANIYGVLASAADAISASRPGARSESAAIYLERLTKLEAMTKSFPGVERVYAIHAGREIRVIVEPFKINDDAALLLARDIARKIEREMHYPGQIKVVVMRETRVVEYAK